MRKRCKGLNERERDKSVARIGPGHETKKQAAEGEVGDVYEAAQAYWLTEIVACPNGNACRPPHRLTMRYRWEGPNRWRT